MYNKGEIDPGHRGPRNFFRAVGPVVAVIGLILIVVGIGSFFSKAAKFGDPSDEFGPPKYFWCVFVGIPVLFVGLVLSKFGYMGKVARYVAQEIAPVGKDTFNYMAEGTKDGVRTVAGAIGEGLREGMSGESGAPSVRCHKCNALVDEGAKFCSDCGTSLEKSKPCGQCGELNDPDAKYCDNCGGGFA